MAQGHLESPGAKIHTVTQDNSSPAVGSCGSSESPNILRHRMVRSKTPPHLRMPRLSHSGEDDSIAPRPARERLNSREYTHSYDGAYGAGNDDMIGVNIGISAGGWWEKHQYLMFTAYVLVLFFVVLPVVTMALSPADGALADMTFTVTNLIHFAITLIYLHWMKGGCGEGQLDLEHMTLWEQIEATPHTGWLRFGLRVVPVLLCWCACSQAQWELQKCRFNLFVLFLTMLGKLPLMNGVRLLGINAHPVIGRGD